MDDKEDEQVTAVFKLEPQPGPQTWLLAAPADEILFGGARGGGKTYGILLHWALHNSKYKGDATGLLLRKTFRELEHVIKEAKKLFVTDTKLAIWKENKHQLEFTNGSILRFGYLETPDDAEQYQGSEFTVIYVEEAGNFATSEALDPVIACLRSTVHGIKLQIIYTANPGGAGHQWLKSRFIDPVPPFKINTIKDSVSVGGKVVNTETRRLFIQSKVTDNAKLMESNPNYITNIKNSTNSDSKLKAWLDGDWDSISGSVFDMWDNRKHIIEPFDIPHHWKCYKSFDWGFTRPFSVGWWTVVPESVTLQNGSRSIHFYKDTVIRVAEYYGCVPGKANQGLKLSNKECAIAINAKEALYKRRGLFGNVSVGPADSAIFNEDGDGPNVADKHKAQGIIWQPVKKGRNSRVNGWDAVKSMMAASTHQPMEEPGLYVFNTCEDFIRTVPLATADKKNPDDVDSDTEDHILDEMRYFVMWEKGDTRMVDVGGV